MLSDIKDFIISKNTVLCILIIIAAFVFWFIIKKTVIAIKNKKTNGKEFSVDVSIPLKIIKYVIIVIVCLMVLQVYNINVSSLIAGLGIVGIVVGFALQDLLKDIIMGTNIVMGSFFSAGDIVVYNNIEAEVLNFNIKSTKLLDISTGNILTVSNRNISEITVLSDWFKFVVPSSYDVEHSEMIEVCNILNERFSDIDGVKKCECLGTEGFESSYITYSFKVFCDMKIKPTIRRACLSIVQDEFEKRNLSVPYDQIDVHLNN